MNILVYGLGALGTVYACLLKEAGHRVVGLLRKSSIRSIGEQGLRVTGIWGEHCLQLDQLVSRVEDIGNKDLDLVILTVKSYDTKCATEEIAKIVSPKTYVILAQNGYGNFEAAAGLIPGDKLIVARVIFGAETLGPGASKVTVIADDVVLGSPKNGIPAQLLEKLVRAFCEAGIPTRSTEQVMKYIWGKIIYNSALNSLGAILEVNYGKLAEVKYSRSLMDSVVWEIFAVLNRMEQDTLWPDAAAYLKDFYEKMIPATASHHPSMLQDIQRGKRTEIDALNGAVVEMGKRYGVDTPVNKVIVSLVKAKEQLVSKPC